MTRPNPRGHPPAQEGTPATRTEWRNTAGA